MADKKRKNENRSQDDLASAGSTGAYESEGLPEKARPKRDFTSKGGLNINSIMDMMTILLVYLMVSLTSDPLNIKMDDYLVLARSTANFAPQADSIPITITKRHIVVDNQPVVTVHCKFQGRECTDDDIRALSQCQAYIAECGPQGLDFDHKLSEPKAFADTVKTCEGKADKACSVEELAALETIRFYFDKTDKQDGDENKFLIVPLLTRLKELVKQKREEDQLLQLEFRGITTVIADQHIPFRMIAEVVHTAGMAELNEIRFAIVKVAKR
jgi:hypothetical protein